MKNKTNTPPHQKDGTFVGLIRFYQKCYRKGYKRFAKFLYWIVRIVFSCDIPCTVKIGNGFTLPHFGLGVVIYPDTIIGDNVCIFQQVTIGVKYRRGGSYMTIGNNVLIGSGAKIMFDGDSYIGNNVSIGANSVVLQTNVPDNSTLVGIPAKIITKNND